MLIPAVSLKREPQAFLHRYQYLTASKVAISLTLNDIQTASVLSLGICVLRHGRLAFNVNQSPAHPNSLAGVHCRFGIKEFQYNLPLAQTCNEVSLRTFWQERGNSKPAGLLVFSPSAVCANGISENFLSRARSLKLWLLCQATDNCHFGKGWSK
jgi:hypothetical protein